MRKHAFPPNWCLTKLSEVAAPVPNSIVDGPFGSNLKLSDYIEEGVPVLQGKNITNNRFQWFDVRFISELKAKELKRSSVRVGDILLVKIGSIGYSAVVRDLQGFDFAIIPANLAKITPNLDIIDTDYLHRWITSPTAKHYLENSASKTAQPALSLGKIKNLPVPLPPLPEQRRIAYILDRAEALRAKRRATLTQLDELTQAIFFDMFGDPVSNPMGWKKYPLKHCVNHIQIGPFGSLLHKDEYIFGGIPLINPTHIEDGKIVPDLNQSITLQKHAGLQLYQLQQGDVIMGRRGEMGRCAIVGPEHNGMLCGTGSLFIRPDESKAIAIYLQATLSSASMRKHLESFSLGVTLPNLNRGIVGELAVSLPPVELQKEFAHRIESIDKFKSTYKTSLVELDELFSSLQYRAFRGEL